MKSEDYDLPADRYYERSQHMWAKSDAGSNRILVGIDKLGLEALGELAYVSVNEPGAMVKAGESLGALEAAKMTGDLIAPVSGKLVARNDAAIENPGLINQDPYTKGWIVVIEADNWEAESAQLVSGDELSDWVAAEVKRYREQGLID